MNPTQNLIFDLDGTLTDSQDGIIKSIQYALVKLNLPVPSSEDLKWCIGPPIQVTMARVLRQVLTETGRHRSPTAIDSEKAVELFRERYAELGIYENQLYPGIQSVLEKLKNSGYKLWVATSKPEIFARKIIAYFSLTGFFEKIYGCELDGTRGDKAELLAYLLNEEKLDPISCVMIGDREHDATGAKKNQILCLGAGWGYGTSPELLEAGAISVLKTPSDLPSAILALGK